MHHRLAELGWDPAWESVLATVPHDGLAPARVAVEHRGAYRVYTAEGEALATVSGHLRHAARTPAHLPAVGDWVLLRDAVIPGVLPRRTAFVRKVALAATEEQVVAANADVVFVVAALDTDLNFRRLERFLTFAYESGAEPVVLLTKADLCGDLPGAVEAARAVAPGTPVHALSARNGEGLEAFDRYCRSGRTAVLLGPSGVGKTTLLNVLTGEDRSTAAVLQDGRGRHTTTRRELVLVAGRGLVMDTPGLRELQLWEADAGRDTAFADLAALAHTCQFADCHHEREPGCAVGEAIRTGALPVERLASYRKLEREELRATGHRRTRTKADAHQRWQNRKRRLLRHLRPLEDDEPDGPP